jgi:hypothetical protein
MATVTNKRKVLSVKRKVNFIQRMVNRKMKAGLCWEFGLINSRSQRFGNTEPKLLVCLNRMDKKKGDIENLNEMTLMRCCLSGCSNREVEMYQ